MKDNRTIQELLEYYNSRPTGEAIKRMVGVIGKPVKKPKKMKNRIKNSIKKMIPMKKVSESIFSPYIGEI